MSTLNPPVLFRLDLACKPIAEAFGHKPYLVGSVQERTSKAGSDVDVRLILPDEEYDALSLSPALRTLLDLALGAFLRELTGLPVDFQIQRMTEANKRHPGKARNPLGGRDLTAWIGDSSPLTPREQVADLMKVLTDDEITKTVLASATRIVTKKREATR